jgi:ABC-type antimicrobial peptide transport system permease subunit
VRNTALEEAPRNQLYLPLTRNPMLSLDLVVRTSASVAPILATIREAVHAADPSQPIGRFRTMDDLVARATSQRRFLLWLLGAFGAIALVLASLGTYGVIAYGVAQRRGEIGIRLALGAPAGSVQWTVLKRTMLFAAAGVAIGLAAAFVLGRSMTSLLYEVKSTDPATFVAVVFVLIVVAGLSSYLPARRAARVDPLVALRYE